jgi:hypothetical protein
VAWLSVHGSSPAEHHQTTMPGSLKLAYQMFKRHHHMALPKVLHCAIDHRCRNRV